MEIVLAIAGKVFVGMAVMFNAIVFRQVRKRVENR